MLDMEIAVTPNPFKEIVEITIGGKDLNDNHFIISLNNREGKILRMIGIQLNKGNNHFVMERLQVLDQGSYHLKIHTIEGECIHQVALQKD